MFNQHKTIISISVGKDTPNMDPVQYATGIEQLFGENLTFRLCGKPAACGFYFFQDNGFL